MRYFIKLQFNGQPFCGWQIQPNAISVQEVLQKALSTLLRENVQVIGAGRTDAGVHAKEMFAHFDTSQSLETDHLTYRLNSILPKEIAVYWLKSVKEDAHARFSAVSRSYEYWMHFAKNPFLEGLSYRHHTPVDFEKMNRAAQYLIGEKSFRCFEKSHAEENTGICDLHRAEWKEVSPGVWVFHISANRFLRNMVRAITGTLLEVGMEKRRADSIPELLASSSRTKAGVSVPAHGLYLSKVEYPIEIYL
jgi:tRNA pseudouridine38-40 synthase